MRRTPVTAPRSPRVLHLGLALALAACTDTTQPPGAARLAFNIEPGTTIAGAAIFPALVVALQDEAGNTLTTERKQISLALGGPSAGTLDGTTSAATVKGVATFPGLRINLAGDGYTITASAAGVPTVTSAPFSVTPGAATHLAFVVQPVTTVGRVVMSPVRVAFKDHLGNTATGSSGAISLRVSANVPATLSGVTTVEAVNGIATFSGLTIDNTGNSFVLIASRTGLPDANSAQFSVTFAAAAALFFGVEPWTAKPGEPVAPAVTVRIVDAHGNTVANATNLVSIAMGQNPAGGVLSGTITATPANGVAVFSNLVIDRLGSGYTITAAASGLSPTETAVFAVRGPLNFSTVSSGYFHSCGVASDNASYCWGTNFSGELGNPSLEQSDTPVPVTGEHTFTRISAGRSHSCALTVNGAAYCWGANNQGQLGNGTGTLSRSPSAVSGNLIFAALTAGYSHTCGVTSAGIGYCWGDNAAGQLGNPAVPASRAPIAVSGGLAFVSISPGRLHTCGRTVDGAAYCWGDNNSGQLGDGTSVGRSVPTPVHGGLTFSSLSAGGFHSCGVTTDGIARCWGQNAVGQLGTGTLESRTIPLAVAGAITFASVSAGNRHTCGLTPGGGAYCWGENALGYLGDGTSVNRSSPTAPTGGRSFAGISAGRFHSCAVTVANEAYCWGDNGSGRLGIGPAAASLEPARVR